jgi:hypothetical protein
MDSIAVMLTNQCVNRCSNCTQLCGHHDKPYYATLEQFKQAVDSLVGYPNVFGFHGGEPLLHPQFEEFCKYALSKIPRERLGLWTCLPKGKEHYRELIVETFGNVFLNDHSKADILHAPILVGSEEITSLQEWQKQYLRHHCWVQNSWSAAVIDGKAYFCEVAAAIAYLLKIDVGWELTPDWWTRSPQDFGTQLELCKLCGCALPMLKRSSTDSIDDMSPKWVERLKDTSPKIKKGGYILHDMVLRNDDRVMAAYKEQSYRDAIASRYGIFLMTNQRKYNEPYLMKNWSKGGE